MVNLFESVAADLFGGTTWAPPEENSGKIHFSTPVNTHKAMAKVVDLE